MDDMLVLSKARKVLSKAVLTLMKGHLTSHVFLLPRASRLLI